MNKRHLKDDPIIAEKRDQLKFTSVIEQLAQEEEFTVDSWQGVRYDSSDGVQTHFVSDLIHKSGVKVSYYIDCICWCPVDEEIELSFIDKYGVKQKESISGEFNDYRAKIMSRIDQIVSFGLSSKA